MDKRSRLVFVGFRADAETVEAINKLTARVVSQRGTVAAKSVAIRRALIEAAGRLADSEIIKQSKTKLNKPEK